MAVRQVPIDPDAGIPDLIRRLGDDSKRLVTDEIQLAKLETMDSVHTAARGALYIAVALGIGVLALVALTIFVAALIGMLVRGHMWVGAIVTGVIEIIVAVLMIKNGLGAFTRPSYSLAATREELKETAKWVAHPTEAEGSEAAHRS